MDDMGFSIPVEQHASASAIERRLPEIAHLKFIGFVRHPVTWYSSMWSWAMRRRFGAEIASGENELANRHWLAAVWSESFSEFIDRVLALQVPRAWVVFHEKLTRQNGLCEIGKYESLATNLYKLTGCTGIQSERPRASGIQAVMSLSQEHALKQLERETIRKWYS